MTALVRIVLIDPSHPGNIGSVARAMKNMALERSGAGEAALLSARRSRSRSPPVRTTSWRGARIGRYGRRGDRATAASSPARRRARAPITGSSRRRAMRRRASSALGGENRAALLFGSERYGLGTEDLHYCNVLVRIPANPDYCSLNLAMSVQLLAVRDVHGARAARGRACNWSCRSPPRATSSTSTRICSQVLERDRFRGSHRVPDGAAAAAVQPRAARSQRAQHPARHLERRAGAARPVGAPRRANERAPARVSGLCGDHAGGAARSAARMAAVPDRARARSAIPSSASHDYGEAATRAGGGGARAGGRDASARSPPRSSGPRARPRRTTSRSSASPTTTATSGRHIVTARTEHKAVLDPCRELERRGWRVTYLTPGSERRRGSGAGGGGARARTRCWCRSCTSTTRSA